MKVFVNVVQIIIFALTFLFMSVNTSKAIDALSNVGAIKSNIFSANRNLYK